jgi:glyoxylase-like metal-dependent hydrolase (beta-lactamase superfamily II)
MRPFGYAQYGGQPYWQRLQDVMNSSPGCRVYLLMSMRRLLAPIVVCFFSSAVSAKGITEFCLDGEFDLGARYQGTDPQSGEFYPTTWCVITEDESHRVLFSGAGRSNPDMDGEFTVAYLPPDTVRIVNREAPPDVEFHGTDNHDEALRVRRLDPLRLLEEYKETPDSLHGVSLSANEDRVVSVKTSAALPLRGEVSVEWHWDWTTEAAPTLRLMLDGVLLFKATGRWRDLPAHEAATLWGARQGADPIEVPGDRWPARIDMQLSELTEGVYLVSGVRSGFQHLVVDTDEGLVVADAPAGWVEFHHIPPSDLVPGLGVSGLSENFIDFLNEQFNDRPIRAVALTHFHDDHAGGARAFAAAGAEIYATKATARFMQTALNRPAMPSDRLAERATRADVIPVANPITIGDSHTRVTLMPMGSGPHVSSMLGVWVPGRDYFFVSDVHVPRSKADAPRENRAATECWFAAWAVENLPPEVRVANSHSSPVTPVSRLEAYLESDVCRGQALR